MKETRAGQAVKIGLLGFAHVHAASYATILTSLEGAIFQGIYDEVASRGRAAALRLGVPYYESLDRFLEDCDAVVVATTNRDHYRFALACAAAGDHVLCEKPLATRVEDAEEMIRRCREANVRLMTAFPMRFNVPVLTALSAVRNGDVGEVLAITGSNNGQMPGGWFSSPELAGGGAAMDHVVHLADLMHWFTGSVPNEVYAEMDTLLHEGIEVEDVAIILLRFPDGMVGSIDASWSRPEAYPTWGGLRFRVVGSKGVIDVDAFSQNLAVYRNQQRLPAWRTWGSDADRAMLQGFVQAIQGGQEVPVTGEDGLAALRVVQAAYASARRGEPVAL